MYEDVIKDISELKKSAEDSAIKTLTEAMVPRIREFIESELIGSIDGSDFGGGESLGDPFVEPESLKPTEKEISVTTNVEVPAELPIDAEETPSPEEETLYDVDDNSLDDIAPQVANTEEEDFAKKLTRLESKMRSLQEQKVTSPKEITSTLLRVNDMYVSAKRIKNKSLRERHEKILSGFKKILSRKQNMKNISEDVTIKLSGLPEDLDLEDLGVELASTDDEEGGDLDGGDDTGDESGGDDLDLGDDEGSSDGGDDGGDLNFESDGMSDDDMVEIDESLIKREIAKMRSVKENKSKESTKVPSVDGHGAGDVSDDFEADNFGDPFTDVTLSESDDVEDMEECDNMESEPAPTGLPESVKKEFKNQSRLQVEAHKRVKKAVSLYRKTMSEAKSLQDKVASCRKKKDSTGFKKASALLASKKKTLGELKEAHTFYSRKLRECKANKARLIKEGSSRNSKPERSNANEASLKKKLTETNLFNTKLMYSNKVLLDDKLDKKTKASIIERLEECLAEREVKLVYESLIKTIGGKKPSVVTESAGAGSSSRPTTSGSPSNVLKESYDVDRWARLAGIKLHVKKDLGN